MPLALLTLKYLAQDIPDHPDRYRVNFAMLQLHLLGSLALVVGLTLSGFIWK